MEKPQISVLNKYHGVPAADHVVVSIMRSVSVLGNPYSHLAHSRNTLAVATRDDAVDLYRVWLKQQMRITGPVFVELRRLADIASAGPLGLLCVCAPAACHGHIIADAVRFLVENPEWEPILRQSATAVKRSPTPASGVLATEANTQHLDLPADTEPQETQETVSWEKESRAVEKRSRPSSQGRSAAGRKPA